MKDELVSYKKLLEKKGYKLTLGRLIVLETILNSKIHLSIKEIAEIAKEKHIGIAAIYRALRLFDHLGIVKEITIDGIDYYEIKLFSGKSLHIHFKCLQCNSIIDIDSHSINLEYLKLNSKLEVDNNLEIQDSNIVLKGLCSKCREDFKCQDQQSLEE